MVYRLAWRKDVTQFTKVLPVFVTVVATVGSAVLTPDFLAHHVTAYAVLNATAQLLHAALPSVFGQGSGK
jgi:hypothetical protein